VKPNSTKKSSLNRLDVQTEDGLWQQIVGKTQVEEHLIERNVEQFSHAGATPLGYTDLGRELVMSFICASVINHDITKVMGQ
jgi:hypothetical protein